MPTWFRKWGFTSEADGDLARKAKNIGGPHKMTWPGANIGSGFAIECRIFIPGHLPLSNLKPVGKDVTLFPPPKNDECLIAIIILGPPGGSANLTIAEFRPYAWCSGNLCDGHGVWIFIGYIDNDTVEHPGPHNLPPMALQKMREKAGNNLRGIFPANNSDGSLALWDIPV